jgi:hypothetical protein
MGKKSSTAPWVVLGGTVDEQAHCQNCGAGLSINRPQSIEVMAAAMTAFLKIHSDCTTKTYEEPAPRSPLEWATGRDVGVSSMTIHCVLTGAYSPYKTTSPPRDGQDFGRCSRYLKLFFPDYNKHLHFVSYSYPAWLPYTKHWDEFEELYAKGQALGSFEDLNRSLRELRDK